MKQFFKMMFASILGVLAAIGILFFLCTIFLIGMVGSMGSSSNYVPKSDTVYKISLNGEVTEDDVDNPFAMFMGKSESSTSMKSLLASIKNAKENKNIKGIYLEAGLMSLGSANVQTLRNALIDFKESGKFLIAYGDYYTQGNYYLCSVADEVFMNPQGILELKGLASQTMFYTGLLEKLGVEMQIFKVGTYKGAVEPFMLDKLSDANREQIQSYANSIWNNIATGIAEQRNINISDVNHFADEALYFSDPEKTIEAGLINALKYKSDAEAYVKELAGQTGDKLRTVGLDKMKNIKTSTPQYTDQIAVLYAEGEITEEISGSVLNTSSNITQRVADELIKLKNNDDVKAVVLRVNSPGGSAYVSEQIWKQVIELKKEKPVVVSMGNVAASGGYYISCAADKIIAEPSTLTGSIGIFGVFPNVTGTFKKLDLTTDIVKTNKYADIGDLSRPMQSDEKALIQAYIERGYDLFITRCADGRAMTKAEIDAVGQGRVWTGEQAVEIGLVDELGGIDKAIETAADLAELSDYNIVGVSGSKDFFQDFLEKQLNDIKMSVVKNTLGSDFEYIQTLNRIRSTSGIQARLPYDIKPL